MAKSALGLILSRRARSTFTLCTVHGTLLRDDNRQQIYKVSLSKRHSTAGGLSLAQGQGVLVVSLLLLPQFAFALRVGGPGVPRGVVVVAGGRGSRGQAGEGVLDLERVLVSVVPERVLGELEAGVAALGPGRGRRRRARRRRAAIAAARVVVVVAGVGMPRNAVAVVVVVDAGELRRISR